MLNHASIYFCFKIYIMKKVLFSGVMCLQLVSIQAQQQGTITYERKINLHRRMEDEQMKAMVPEFRTTKHMLTFSDSIAVYKAVKEDESPDPFDNSSGGGPRLIRIGPGDNGMIYKNFTTKQIAEQTEFADKNYIIDDSIKAQPWKLAEETKTILGHVSKKATMKTVTGNDVSAWYAGDIPTPAGPENFSGLPGAVLAVDVNNGEIVFTAIAIKLTIDRKELAAPKTGKHISRADFQKKMEEILGPAGPGGRRIRIND